MSEKLIPRSTMLRLANNYPVGRFKVLQARKQVPLTADYGSASEDVDGVGYMRADAILLVMSDFISDATGLNRDAVTGLVSSNPIEWATAYLTTPADEPIWIMVLEAVSGHPELHCGSFDDLVERHREAIKQGDGFMDGQATYIPFEDVLSNIMKRAEDEGIGFSIKRGAHD